jgi:osmotically-inducible protein OsmY
MSDSALRQDVIDELEFDPALDASGIGVAVENGVVTLTGHVASYAQKLAAERAAARVEGVKGIAEELQVRSLHGPSTDDDEIVRRAIEAMRWSTIVPEGQVLVKAEKGWVTLTGTLEWEYQRAGAGAAIANIPGITGIANLIDLKPRVSSTEVKTNIDNALRRRAGIDHRAITVKVGGNRVTLDGTVRSWTERSLAEQAAWSSAGVTVVDNRLLVG